MLRRFDCPDCGKFLARTDGQTLETDCRRCHKIVRGVVLDLQLTLECTRCSRRHHYENPASRPKYCVVCGADTLEPLKVPTERPAEALILTMSGR